MHVLPKRQWSMSYSGTIIGNILKISKTMKIQNYKQYIVYSISYTNPVVYHHQYQCQCII